MVDRCKIRKLREAEQLSAKELAERVFVSQPMITCIENGVKTPSVDLLKRIADFFGCTVDDLLTDDKPTTPQQSVM